jgi:biotin carboxyl carrier protein
MFKCIYCGFESINSAAKFCSECGPFGPAHSWSEETVDQASKIVRYAELISEYYFQSHTDFDFEKLSLRLRERLRISHAAHTEVLRKLSDQKKAVAHLSNFRLEFNDRVTDAYAGHDTFLDFRYTNLSAEDAFKVSLIWDDPDTVSRVDLQTSSKNFVKPLASLRIGGSVIFDRIGTKEISDLYITITDQLGESARFRSDPFRFKVGSHEQSITNNISTHNQISIEGRGVVDATGMGANNPTHDQPASDEPSWKQLSFSYLPYENERNLAADLTSNDTSAAEQKKVSFQELGGAATPLISDSISSPTYGSQLTPEVQAIEVRVPNMGDTDTFVVVGLLVNVGDKITINQPLVTLEDEKVSIDLPSPQDGIVKEIKISIGEKINVGSILLLLESITNNNQAPLKPNTYFPPVSAYVPSTRQYSRLTVADDLLKILHSLRLEHRNWHFLVSGAESVPKLLIRELILQDQNFSSLKTASSRALESIGFLAAIFCELEPNSLLELEGLDELFSPENNIGDIVNSAIADFQLDILIGEGVDAKPVKLDLTPFCSIFYCKDINEIPVNLLNLFHCCLTLE